MKTKQYCLLLSYFLNLACVTLKESQNIKRKYIFKSGLKKHHFPPIPWSMISVPPSCWISVLGVVAILQSSMERILLDSGMI